MGIRVVAIPDERRESLRGPVLVSVILHAALFVIAVTYTMFGFHLGGAGREWGTKGALRVGAVSSMPGIPLPTPMLTTPSTVATQSPSPYKDEPKPKEETPPDAVEIPKFKAVGRERPMYQRILGLPQYALHVARILAKRYLR